MRFLRSQVSRVLLFGIISAALWLAYALNAVELFSLNPAFEHFVVGWLSCFGMATALKLFKHQP